MGQEATANNQAKRALTPASASDEGAEDSSALRLLSPCLLWTTSDDCAAAANGAVASGCRRGIVCRRRERAMGSARRQCRVVSYEVKSFVTPVVHAARSSRPVGIALTWSFESIRCRLAPRVGPTLSFSVRERECSQVSTFSYRTECVYVYGSVRLLHDRADGATTRLKISYAWESSPHALGDVSSTLKPIVRW